MKYWEDFESKFGFNDGDSIPPDAPACREVYIRAINVIAARNKSKCRLMAFDRSGMHNPFLIISVSLDVFKTFKLKQQNGVEAIDDDNVVETKPDKGLQAAIEWAHDQDTDLEQYVTSKVSVEHAALTRTLRKQTVKAKHEISNDAD